VSTIPRFFPAIPAGGSGTRLWPLSRTGRPKFLLPLGPDPARSLLQATVDRLLPLCGLDRLLVVTGEAHSAAVRGQLPHLPPANLIAEPSARNSAAPIALAAAIAHERDPDALTGSFAADHVVTDPAAFQAVIEAAAQVAAEGLLVTVGLRPLRPDTGYGYIEAGGPLTQGPGLAVRSFTEKPDAATAREYVATGSYLWNAGMFVWRADALLAEVERQLPGLHDGVRRIAAAYAAGDGPQVHAEIWPTLPTVSIDVGIVEGAAQRGRVACMPADFGWTDVGTFDSLAAVLPGDAAGNVRVGGAEVLAVDSARCVVSAAGRPVVLLGVHDLVVVDAGDVVLVCPRERAQDVGVLVGAVRDAGRGGLT